MLSILILLKYKKLKYRYNFVFGLIILLRLSIIGKSIKFLYNSIHLKSYNINFIFVILHFNNFLNLQTITLV